MNNMTISNEDFMKTLDLEKGQLLKSKDSGALVTVVNFGYYKALNLNGVYPGLELSREDGSTYCMNLRSWEHYYEKTGAA